MQDFIPTFKVDDFVYKDTGDYTFTGVVVSVFRKRSGAIRYVVENKDGICHIFSDKQLKFLGVDMS